MTTDIGRCPDGPGYSAEPEPSFTVSAVPVSIPNADIIPFLPWRSMETFPRDGTIAATWCRAWDRPNGEPRIQFAQWLDPYLNGGKLSAPWGYGNSPYAYGWLPVEELNAAAASAIEARSDETRSGSAEGESAASEAGDAR